MSLSKSKILSYPEFYITPQIRKECVKEKRYGYTLFAKYYPKDKTIVIDGVKVNRKELVYEFRHCIRKDEFRTYNFLSETMRKSTLSYQVYNSTLKVSDEDSKIVEKELGFSLTSSGIYHHEEDIKEKAVFEKKKEELTRVSELFKGIRKPSDKFFKFCHDLAECNYSFVDKANNTVSCPYCGEMPYFKEAKIRSIGTCPKCGTNLTFKSKKISSKYTGQFTDVLLFEKLGDKNIMRLFQVGRNYKNYLLASDTVEEIVRVVFGPNYTYTIYEVFTYDNTQFWDEAKPYKNMYYYRPTTNKTYNSITYLNSNRYSKLAKLCDNASFTYVCDIVSGIDSPLYNSMKKYKNKTLLLSIMSSHEVSYNRIFKSDIKDIEKLLNKNSYFITYTKYKLMRNINKLYNADAFELFELSEKYLDITKSGYYHNTEMPKEYFGLNIKKVINYLYDNKINYRDYIDYIKMSQKCCYEQLIPVDFYPKYFKKAHDELSILSDKEYSDNQVMLFNERKPDWDRFKYENDKFVIMPPESLDDIVKEGKNQNNCVANYIDRILSNQSDILFLRKKESAYKSFCTMQIEGKNISQLRKFANQDVNEKDILKFVNDFAKKNKLTVCI